MHSEDVQAELDELCELLGNEKRDVPPNEHPTTRDKRTKQLRDLVGRRKAERIQALEARGHVRVVAAAGQPGAIDRPDGVADLVGQTIVAGTIERAGKSIMGMRVFPAVGGSAGVLVPIEFLEPAGAEAAAAGAEPAAVGAEPAAVGAEPAVPPDLPSSPLASPRPPRLARDPTRTPDSWASDYPDSYPSWLARAWAEAVGVGDEECLPGASWMMERASARAYGLPFGPDMRMSSSPRPSWHPPGCPCGRPTCPIPVEERISRMEI